MKIQKDSPKTKKKNKCHYLVWWLVFSETFIYSSKKYGSEAQKQISQSYHSFRAKLLDLQLNSLAFITLKNADALFQSLNSFWFRQLCNAPNAATRSWYASSLGLGCSPF